MCKRLGRKHPRYIDRSGAFKFKVKGHVRNHTKYLFSPYQMQLLLTKSILRNTYWNTPHDFKRDISKRITPSKLKYQKKLERYYNRTNFGK